MPQIREYTNKVDISPDDRGIASLGRAAQATGSEAQDAETAARATGQATASIGASLGGAVSEVGGLYDQYKTHQEISRAGPVMAFMQDQWNQQWLNTLKTSDPSDPTVRQNFIENTIKPSLDKWQDGFTTQESRNWAAGQASAAYEHQFQKTTADQMTLAGAEAVQAREVYSSQQATNVLNDPTSYDVASKALDDYHDGTVSKNPNLSAQAQAQLGNKLLEDHTELARNQVRGRMLQNPQAGLADLLSGNYDTKYLRDSDIRPLETFGRSLVAMDNEAQRAQSQQVKLQQKSDAEDFLKGEMGRISWNSDGTANIPPDFFASTMKAMTSGQLPGLTYEMARTQLDWAQTQIHKANEPDHSPSDLGTYAALHDMLANPQYTPHQVVQEVMQQNQQGHINQADAKDLINKTYNITPEQRKALQDQNAYIKSFTGFIDNTVLGANNDPQGKQKAYEFTKKAQDIFSTQGDTPQSRQQIRNMVGSFSLTNKEALANLNQKVDINGSPLAPAAPVNPAMARHAGESQADYLKRRGL